MTTQAVLYTDGGSRGNPGPSGVGFVIFSAETQDQAADSICEGGAFIGEATNNVAEYQAMLWGLENAHALGVRHLKIRADSELLVKQVKGEYKVRNEGIKPLFNKVVAELSGFTSFEISHVYREDNSRADALANEAMDLKENVGSFCVPCAASPSTMMHYTDAQGASQGLLDTKTDKRTTMSSGYYTLTVKDHFDAAHALVGYPGECRRLHGHTWDIEVSVSGRELDEVGIVYDFKSLKDDLASIIKDYDHRYLNEVPPFDTFNSTAENLARVFYERLEEMLPESITLVEVGVWESPIAKLTYRKD